jgi:hypothetical protein
MRKAIAVGAACVALAVLSSCGGATVQGHGTVVVQGLAPGQELLCNPTQGDQGGSTLTVLGSGFLSEHGVNITVTFIADDGTPLQGGTSATEDVPGEVISDTEVVCGIPNLVQDANLSIRVTLPGGNFGVSLPGQVQVGGNLVGPFAFSDLYSAVGNVPLTVSADQGVLANDFARQCSSEVAGKPRTGGLPPSVTGFTVVAYDTMSTNGGTVSMDTDGSFTYSPPTGYQGFDTFDYTMEEAGFQSSTTVYVDVEDMVWFVDDTAPSGGDGHFERPFDSLGAFNAVQNGGAMLPAAGDWIFVYHGDGQPYDGGISLLPDQHLIGEGVDLVVQSMTIVPAGSRPILTNSAGGAVLTAGPGAVVELSDANEVRGVDIQGPTGYGIRGLGVAGPTTIDQVSIDNVDFDGIDLEGVTGTFQVGDAAGSTQDRVRITNMGGTGIYIRAQGVLNEHALTGTAAQASLNVDRTTIASAVEGDGIDAYDVNLDVDQTSIDDVYTGILLWNDGVGTLDTFSITNTVVGSQTVGYGPGLNLVPQGGNLAGSVADTQVTARGSALDAGTSVMGGGTIALGLSNDTFASGGSGGTPPAVSIMAPAGTTQAYLTALSGTVTLPGSTSSSGFVCSNVVFDADPDTAGVQTVMGNDLHVGTSAAARIQGTALDLTDCSGALDLDNLVVFQQGGDVTGIHNTGTLILTITTTSVDQVP